MKIVETMQDDVRKLRYLDQIIDRKDYASAKQIAWTAHTHIKQAAALIEKMAEALRNIELEASAGIAGEPIYKGYPDHDSVPNGLRTVAHIKFSMIRERARDILKELGQ